jgi:LysM repeat protein
MNVDEFLKGDVDIGGHKISWALILGGIGGIAAILVLRSSSSSTGASSSSTDSSSSSVESEITDLTKRIAALETAPATTVATQTNQGDTLAEQIAAQAGAPFASTLSPVSSQSPTFSQDVQNKFLKTYQYLLQPGDTWVSVARKFGVGVDALKAANSESGTSGSDSAGGIAAISDASGNFVQGLLLNLPKNAMTQTYTKS